MRRPKYLPYQLDYIRAHHEEKTARELADCLNMELITVFNIARRYGFVLKKHERKAYVPKPRKHAAEAFVPDPPKEVICRPPAVYSNHSPFGIAS